MYIYVYIFGSGRETLTKLTRSHSGSLAVQISGKRPQIIHHLSFLSHPSLFSLRLFHNIIKRAMLNYRRTFYREAKSRIIRCFVSLLVCSVTDLGFHRQLWGGFGSGRETLTKLTRSHSGSNAVWYLGKLLQVALFLFLSIPQSRSTILCPVTPSFF